jgi:Beta-lactamase class C and other penicillin binding proteins
MTAPIEELLPRATQLIQQGIQNGLHWGVQLFISQDFQPIVDAAIGEDAPGRPLSTETILPWLSAGKPITAAVILQRVELGQLNLDQPVSKIIPEFAAAGKEQITIKDLLTHIGALKPIATGWPRRSWQEIIEKICTSGTRRDRGDGLRSAYDPARSWFILGEILQRIDLQERSVDQIVRQELLEPLGMWDTWMVVPEERMEDIRPRLGHTYVSKEGVLSPAETNTELYCRHCAPGGSLRGPIRDLARFYEMMLRGGVSESGIPVLEAESIALMTTRTRVGEFDATFQHTVDFGLGMIVNSNRYGAETVPYGFGRYASENSFGHGGSQSSIGFADPERKLVLTAVANGMPGDDLHNQRFRDIISAIYEDLKLV